MKDFLKKIFRPLLYLIISVYILSIPIQGNSLYSYARKILVENRVVGLVQEHSSAIYNQLCEKVRLALLESASHKDKSTN